MCGIGGFSFSSKTSFAKDILFEILDKLVAVIGWLLLVTAGIMLFLYKLYTNKQNRDKIFYDQYNFGKPTRENILRSRLTQELNEKCEKEPKNDDDDYSSEFYSFSFFCYGQKGIRMVEIYLGNYRVGMLDNVDLFSNEKVDL